MNMRSFCAEDGEKALEILKSKEIHLALLDIMLPKKNGIEVLKELRTFSELPVIMLTAVTDEETQVQTFDNLADDYICKPFSLILLLKRIEALLRARYKTEKYMEIQRCCGGFFRVSGNVSWKRCGSHTERNQTFSSLVGECGAGCEPGSDFRPDLG